MKFLRSSNIDNIVLENKLVLAKLIGTYLN